MSKNAITTNTKIIKSIIRENIKNGDDFEFYPTTNEILDAMYYDIKSHKINHSYNYESASAFSRLCKYEHQSLSFLDIGAGSCKLFHRISELSKENYKEDKHGNPAQGDMIHISKYMVIEKSKTLLDKMHEDTFVVGTDFNENFLVDKRADIVFCNPPYSEYAQWTQRIIKEANSDYIYLVIPKRWGTNAGIAGALKERRAKVKIIGDFSFENAEDRKARAYVSLVKVCLKTTKKIRGNDYDVDPTDPFEAWINETFDFSQAMEDTKLADYQIKKQKAEDLKGKLVNAPDLVGTLVKLYNQEMESLIENYKKVSELDAGILEELDVSISKLRKGLKEKIVGLKHRYWQEIFDNLSDINKRLTSKSRTALVGTLNSNTNIDFTSGNIRAVVIWAIKNANKYYNQQMLEVYDDFTTEEGITLYKSNRHFNSDTWRYNRHDENLEKYSLDYRIVKHGWIDDYDKKYRKNISAPQIKAIDDILVIGKNLGFTFDNSNIATHDLERGEKEFFYTNVDKNRILKKGTKTQIGKIDEVYVHTNKPNANGERVEDVNGVLYVYNEINKSDEVQYKIEDSYYNYNHLKTSDDIFTTVKGFQNGNVHYQFHKNFIKKLNLEVGRLRGWIKSPQEAAEEFDISIAEANEYWNSTFMLLPSNLPNLLPNHSNEEVITEEEQIEETLSKEVETVLEDTITIDAIETTEEKEIYTEEDKAIFSNGSLF